MAKPKQGSKDAPPVGDIASQIIVSFNSKVGVGGKEAAIKNVEPVLTALQSLPLTVVKYFVSNPAEGKPARVVAILQLKDPAFGLRELSEFVKKEPSCKDIAHVERNAPITIAATTFTDPLAGQQWALKKMGVTGPWTVTPPAGKTIVAIIDSGLRRHDGSVHADLGSVEPLADCQPTGFYADNIDQEGHGTLLAGTIAAQPNNIDVNGNPVGIASAIPSNNWNISLLPVKFFNPGTQPNVGDAVIAIEHALDMGANVINASWHVALGDDKQALKDAFERAKNEDCLVVVAAGNDGTNNEVYPTYPANYGSPPPGNFGRLAVLTVAATDRHDDKASFSNYGPNIVDLAAPGQDILTTGPYLGSAPPRYRVYHGTSASAAYATAAAALLIALNRQENWRAKVTIQHLVASADTVDRLKLAVVGGKRLNIKRAIEGPLHVTAPAAGDTLVVGTPVLIKWTNDYFNPHLDLVRIRYSKNDGANWRTILDDIDITLGEIPWTPEVTPSPPVNDRTPDGAMTGIIRITPKKGNFPAFSAKFKVV